MPKDKYSAVWVSHSSIADFLRCPRAYFLRNVYKDPISNHKITKTHPSLSLGQVVHEVIELLSTIPAEKRLKQPLEQMFLTAWKKVEGEIGGFKSLDEENIYKERGLKMLKKLKQNPGPIVNKAIKIKEELPFFWLSEEENIILCGKIDWIEYLKDDSVHIIDFKTGKNEEPENSLQLPIYLLVAGNVQNRPVKRLSYWYLEQKNGPVEQKLPDANESRGRVLEIARRIKLGRQIDHFKCPKGGCFACTPLELIIKGKAKLVGVSSYNQDVYILPEV